MVLQIGTAILHDLVSTVSNILKELAPGVYP